MFLLSRRKKPRLKYLLTDSILPNPYQPRREDSPLEDAVLCESIRRLGVLEPLAVHIREDGAPQLLSGERRLRAARAAGFTKVPCVVVEPDRFSSSVYPLCHQIHSKPLTVFEQAAAIRRILDTYRLSRSAAAELLGIKETAVNSQLTVLRLNDAQRQRVLTAGLSREHIVALARIDASIRDRAIDTVISKNLTVADTEKIAVGTIPIPSADDRSRRRTSGIGDLRLFDNSLQRMTEALSASGVKAVNTKRETDGFVEYTVRIYKPDRGRYAEKGEKQLALF